MAKLRAVDNVALDHPCDFFSFTSIIEYDNIDDSKLIRLLLNINI